MTQVAALTRRGLDIGYARQTMTEVDKEKLAEFCVPRGGRSGRSDDRLLPDPAVDQLAGDIEVPRVPCVLLKQMEQNSLQSRRRCTVPSLTRSADLVERVSLDYMTRDVGLRLERSHQLRP
jgi:hypothetical protein